MYMRVLYNDIDRAAWSRLVAESTTSTWFQMPEAYDFFASQPELFEAFAIGIENNGLRGVCVGYVTKEKNALKQFFTRRAIIIGGPCLANDCTNKEVENLINAIRDELKQDAIYIETRNFNDYSRWKEAFENAGFAYQPHLNFHIDCTDKDTMWERMNENRKRQIKKALQNGACVEEALSEDDIIAWYSILKNLYRTKVKTPLFPLSFFMAFYRQGLGKYLLVKKDNHVIGGIMCPIWDKKCIYEWFVCGDDVAYKAESPSVMATYGAMEYANAHAIPKFDIMGAGKPNVPYGVRDFKAEFGGQLVEYGRFLNVRKPLLYKIGLLGVKILKMR